jgi:DNA-binding CsgD family transcriptional regulator
MLSRHREALPLLLEARDVATKVGATQIESPSPSRGTSTLGSRVPIALCIGYLGDVEEAIRLLVEERWATTQKQAVHEVVGTYMVHALILEAACRFEDAVTVAEQGLAAVRAFALEQAVAPSLQFTMAEALRHLGRWTEAETVSGDISRDFARRGGTGWVDGGVRAARGLLLAGMGRLDEADEESRRAWEAFPHGPEAGGVGFNGLYFAGRAEAALQRSDPAGAAGYVAEGLHAVQDSEDVRWIGHLSTLGLRAQADRAEVARAHREEAELAAAHEAGERHLDGLRLRVTRCLQEGTIFRREAPAHLALGEAEFARLSGRADPQLWSAAARAWEAIPEPYAVGYALYRQGEDALRTSRARDEPARLLGEARAIADRLGAEPLRRQIDSVLSRARLEPAHAARIATPVPDRDVASAALDRYGLTPREREVLSMLATGRSDREIAEALYISVKTASVHVSNIKGKLGVNHRIEAATVAMRLGIAGDHRVDRT